MLVQRYHSDSLELVRWAIVVALALALTLTWAATVVGQTDVPKLLPKEATKHARPIAVKVETPVVRDDYATTLKLWRAIGEFEEGQFDSATALLAEVRMPVENEVWRHVGLAVGHFRSSDFTTAVRDLQKAIAFDPGNPVAHFVLGQVRLAQSHQAEHWYEPPTMGTYFISAPTTEVVPNNHAMYRLAAAQSFRQAIAMADNVDLEARLLAVDWVLPPDGSGAMPLETPTVREYMVSLGTANFPGKSHLYLATLDLERGWLKSAIDHLKSATEYKMRTGGMYEQVGEALQDAGQHRAAARSYLRAMAHGGGTVTQLRNVLDNIGDSLFRK